MLREHLFPLADFEINVNGVRQHIYTIIREKHWKMVKPSTIELKRCCILKRLQEWFKNPEIRYLLMHCDPRLLFNGDETEICRKLRKLMKVLIYQEEDKASVPGKDLTQKHISLFLAISAAGFTVTPYTVILCGAKNFLPDKYMPFKCYKTENGYMETNTFYDIMHDVFAKYVKRTYSQVFIVSYNNPFPKRFLPKYFS